ncbi:MAG: hypothetical protein EZS28_026370 [Streblomastix strix]|uniref:Uncharacterized protein n=1 Tax=Streblomastix strix TaxID=222440 RepID=A0A5J4V6N4_9EUKA|nr:MAG: hypothetical protein EZS28_026370 [Streblomastix strix]
MEVDDLLIQRDIHDNQSMQEMEKDTGCKSVEQADRRLPFQNARLERVEINNQTGRLGHFTGPLLCIKPPKSPNGIITIPCIRVPEQPLHTQSNAIWNQTLTNILCNSNGTNNITNKNEHRNRNNQLSRRHPYRLLEQGISNEYDQKGNRNNEIFQFHNECRNERDRFETNSNLFRMGMNLNNATVQTKLKKRLLLLHDLQNIRRWTNTETEITVKQTAKLIEIQNYLRMQFQESLLLLNIMDHQKAQAAKLRGWNTTTTKTKTEIPVIN